MGYRAADLSDPAIQESAYQLAAFLAAHRWVHRKQPGMPSPQTMPRGRTIARRAAQSTQLLSRRDYRRSAATNGQACRDEQFR